MSRCFVSTRPSYFFYRHTLTLAVTGIVSGSQSHSSSLITCHVADIAIMDCIGSIFHPSIGTLSESDYHRTHTFSCYISLSIFMPFLQIEHSYSMIPTCNRRGSAKSILLDTIGCIRKRSLIIKAQSLRTCGEWYTPVDGFRTILGTCYRFTNITQKERTGSQDLDIDESQHFYFLNMGYQFGTISTTMFITKHRVIRLIDARYMCQDIRGAPRRTTLIGIRNITIDSHIRSNGINCFLISSDNA